MSPESETHWTTIEPIVGFELSLIAKESISKEFCRHFPNETGGILIGRYSEDLRIATVTRAETKTSDSISGRTWFIRGRSGLTKLLGQLWGSGQYYLGEWHTHPEGPPVPSTTDDAQLQRIAREAPY